MAHVVAKSVQERFEDFAQDNLPPKMEPETAAEARRLFFAGYLEALAAVDELREGGIPQADALRALDAHATECGDLLFGGMVLAGETARREEDEGEET